MACIREILELAMSKETLTKQYYAHGLLRLGFPGAVDFFLPHSWDIRVVGKEFVKTQDYV